jgi:hypothetical protein
MSQPSRLGRYQVAWPFIRDVALFLVGIGGVAWETIHGPADPSLLVLFAGCLGLPIMLRRDEK